MIDLKRELFAIVDRLNAAGLEHAICGGFAVIIHGYPRTTKDIDILIPEETLDRVRTELAAIGYRLESGIIPFQCGKPEERRLFRVSQAFGNVLLTIVLLLVTPFLQSPWESREQLEVDGRMITVVSKSGLSYMNRAAGRHIDLHDLEALGIGIDD